MAKQKPAILTGKFATPEDVGEALGVSKKRVKELKAQLGPIKPAKPKKKSPKPKYGYHRVKIKKGVLGEISKIQEEVDELKDAEAQGVRIMIMCELADIFGALRVYAKKYGLKMRDLHAMSKLTRNAFEKGER